MYKRQLAAGSSTFAAPLADIRSKIAYLTGRTTVDEAPISRSPTVDAVWSAFAERCALRFLYQNGRGEQRERTVCVYGMFEREGVAYFCGLDNVTVIVVDVTGLAEQHRRKLTRKSRATAIMLALLLVAIIAGCAYGFNHLASNAAYLVAQDGKVAVYQGVPGDLFGLSFNHLDRVTDVALDDLQPGTANRLREEGIKVDSLDCLLYTSPSPRD